MSEAPAKSRWRDVVQLDLPLAAVLLVCAGATIIEISRAQEGFWRAWVYTFEWPLIGVFAVWIWYRYRFRGGIRRPSRRPKPHPDGETSPEDPQLTRWQEYQRRLRENTESHD